MRSFSCTALRDAAREMRGDHSFLSPPEVSVERIWVRTKALLSQALGQDTVVAEDAVTHLARTSVQHCRVMTDSWVTSGSGEWQPNSRLIGTEARKGSGGEVLGQSCMGRRTSGGVWFCTLLRAG